MHATNEQSDDVDGRNAPRARKYISPQCLKINLGKKVKGKEEIK